MGCMRMRDPRSRHTQTNDKNQPKDILLQPPTEWIFTKMLLFMALQNYILWCITNQLKSRLDGKFLIIYLFEDINKLAKGVIKVSSDCIFLLVYPQKRKLNNQKPRERGVSNYNINFIIMYWFVKHFGSLAGYIIPHNQFFLTQSSDNPNNDAPC